MKFNFETYRLCFTNTQHARQLKLGLIVYLAFCGLSLLSRIYYPVFGLVTLVGIALPLITGKLIGDWTVMGFTRQKSGAAILWGLVGGLLTSLIGIAVLPQLSIPTNFGGQLLLGLPMWALIISPSQEFFFRGWLQPKFEVSLGRIWGLLMVTLGFTLWHYCAPFSSSPVPLASAVGAISTFAAGLVYGFVFQCTGNIMAPWLAHLATGITFILVGAMDII